MLNRFQIFQKKVTLEKSKK